MNTIEVKKIIVAAEGFAQSQAALAEVDNRRWANALWKGLDWLRAQTTVQYDAEAATLIVVNEYGKAYVAGESCQCKAAEKGNVCYHRGAAFVVREALELDEAAEEGRRLFRTGTIDDLFNDSLFDELDILFK